MSKISLIIQREYTTRVRKKSFIVMTIIGPVLMAALMIAPMIFAKMDKEELKTIAVIDSTGIFSSDQRILTNTNFLKFEYLTNTTDPMKKYPNFKKFVFVKIL